MASDTIMLLVFASAALLLCYCWIQKAKIRKLLSEANNQHLIDISSMKKLITKIKHLTSYSMTYTNVGMGFGKQTTPPGTNRGQCFGEGQAVVRIYMDNNKNVFSGQGYAEY